MRKVLIMYRKEQGHETAFCSGSAQVGMAQKRKKRGSTPLSPMPRQYIRVETAIV